MVTQAVDSNISALIQDLFALQNRVRTANDDSLQDLINAYLLLNRPIIEAGLEAWASAPEEELLALLPEHRELDGAATTHSFSSIATEALRHAQQALATSTGRDLLPVTDDNLHMLDRMLEFAKYLARTDDLELQWSPVSRMLDNPEAPALVERVRAELAPPPDFSSASKQAEPEPTANPEPDAEPEPSDGGAEYRPSATISRDYWTVEDHLGYDFYADAVAAFIQHTDTRPPLTIGIKAPWGAGKTSLMRMIRARLDPDPDSTLHQVGEVKPISNKDVLRATHESRQERTVVVGDLEASSAGDRRATVWFNAWMYQSAEQVWAGLADAIITQLTARMPRRECERFWAQLNLRRIDGSVVRRRIYAALIEKLLPLALTFAGTVVVALAVLLIGGTAAWARITAGSTGIVSTLLFALASARKRQRFLAEPVAGAFGELVSAPDYKGSVGYMHHVRADMQRVLDLVATPTQPVVVFVDDLDRCSYESVAKVIEAINLFLAGEFPNCMFVIAMEPDLVAAQIEVAYKDLFAAVKDDLPEREQGQLGWRFLEKMVQLPLSLPPPNDDQVSELVTSIMSRAAPAPAVDAAAVAHARVRLGEVVGTQLGALSAISETAQQLAATDDAIEPETMIKAAEAEFDERFRDDDPVVQQAIRAHAVALSHNPREIKRFINVFRFYAFIQVRRELRNLQAPSYDQLAKLSALAIHWPHLLGVLGQQTDDGTGVLAQLEELAVAAKDADDNPKTAVTTRPMGASVWESGVTNAKLPAGRAADLMAPDLRRLLAQEPMIGESAKGFL